MSQITLNDHPIGKIYLNGRKYGGGAEQEGPNIADVFNHGSIVGLNPLYAIKSYLKSGGGLTITNDYILRNWGDNACFCFLFPISNKQYSTVCFDVEIPNGNNGTWNTTTIGCRKWENIVGTGYSNSNYIDIGGYYGGAVNYYPVNLINYSNQTNYTHTDPWYKLPRTTIRIQLDNLAAEQLYCLEFHHIDSQFYIYSIWLEP